MTLRIASVESTGLKAKDGTTKLAPVQLIVGPNGSGKSAVLEAIHYAFTGHVTGVKATEIGALFPNPKTVSVVVNAIDEESGLLVSVSRGIQSGKKYARGRAFTRESGTSREAKDASRVDSFITDEFGPRTELFLDAFDPDKNIWSLSAEARLRWTFGVVAGASGWTKERLKEELTRLGHGNPSFGHDVVECLDLNIKSASEWMKSTAKAVREYDAILAGLTDAISEPKPDEIESAKQAVKDARDAFTRVSVRLERDEAVRALAAAEAELETRQGAAGRLGELRAARTKVIEEREGAHKNAINAEVKRRTVHRHHQDIGLAMAAIDEHSVCPTCGAVYDGSKKTSLFDLWKAEQAEREAEMARLDAIMGEWQRGSASRLEDDKAFATEERALIDQGALGVAATETKIRELKEKIKTLAESPDALEEPSAVRARLEEAESKLEDVTNRQQLAMERAKKTAERDKANEAAVLRKKQHEELCDLRTSILHDASRAVAHAIDHDVDDVVAPHGGRWRLMMSEEVGGLDIAYDVLGGSFVRYKAMSSGEKIVATVVLLVALRRLLGPSPWSALLVDNLELTSYQERLKLVTYVSTLSSLFSNIILLSSDNRPLGNIPITVVE